AVVGENKRQQAIMHGEMGDVLRVMGDLAQSKKEEEQSLQLFEEIDDKPGLGRTLLNLGSIVKDMGQAQLALEHYTRALRLAETAKLPPLEVLALFAVASVYTAQHDYPVALSYLERIKLDSTAPLG